jgi:uncharacterized protein GlcG (DUF336 family)
MLGANAAGEVAAQIGYAVDGPDGSADGRTVGARRWQRRRPKPRRRGSAVALSGFSERLATFHDGDFAGEDGSSLLREKIARGKARGALNMGTGSRALTGRAETHPHFVNALVALSGGELVPAPSGVLVRDDAGRVVGAVGVSGHLSHDDEACAVAGILAAKLQPDPG